MWNKHRKAFIAGNYLHIMRVKINSNYLLKLKEDLRTGVAVNVKYFSALLL